VLRALLLSGVVLGALDGVAEAAPSHLTVFLARSPARQRAFDALRAEQRRPGSPQFHRWLTPREIGARFGATDAELAEASAWAARAGLAITAVGNARSMIEVVGEPAAARAAIARGLPASIASISGAAIAGERAHPLHHRRALSAGHHAIAVADFATIYDAAPVYANGITGAGQTIDILGRETVYAADVAAFGTRNGIAMPPVHAIKAPSGAAIPACTQPNCGGTDEALDDQSEAELDVERAGSIAYGATIELVVGSGVDAEDGILVALQLAVDKHGDLAHGDIISVSFGACELLETSDYARRFDALYQQAQAQGQTVIVSAGDSGAAGCSPQFAPPPASQKRNVNALCSSPAATCVGGTEFVEGADASVYWGASGAALSYIPEGAWDEPMLDGQFVAVGTGGGASGVYARPAFQSGLVPGAGNHRLVPDVAISAAGHDPYVSCLAAFGAGCTGSGPSADTYGTSAAAPSMAGIMALVNQAEHEDQGDANAALYAIARSPAGATVFHDATPASSGIGDAACDPATPSVCNNSDPSPTALTGGLAGYALAVGYDQATGWGSMDIAQLIAHWIEVPALDVFPSTVALLPGDPQQVDLDAHGFGASTSVTFACSGAAANVTCTIDGAHATLTAAAIASRSSRPGRRHRRGIGLGVGVLAAALLLSKRRRGRGWARAALLMIAASCGGISADPDAAPKAPPNVMSTVTFTATGTAGASATATLAVLAPGVSP
jgi:subtilase family serine protease